jgi:hypothetical protein
MNVDLAQLVIIAKRVMKPKFVHKEHIVLQVQMKPKNVQFTPITHLKE